jgi:hypothetical protein
MERKVTSIKVNPELWKKFKLYCIENELEMSEELEKMIQDKIQSG